MFKLKDGDVEYDNKCLFCLEPLQESFFSGSYDTYTYCNCKSYVELNKLQDQINQLLKIAELNKEELQRIEEIERLEKRLNFLKGKNNVDI